MSVLRVGDRVLWRGDFGVAAPRPAEVTGIEVVEPGEKYGAPVDTVSWDRVRDRDVVVDLTADGIAYWAYGEQVFPYPEAGAERHTAQDPGL